MVFSKLSHKVSPKGRYQGMDFCACGAEPNGALVIVAVSSSPCSQLHTGVQGSLYVSLPAILTHAHRFLLPSSVSQPRSHFPPLFLPGVRCLVPPLGCCTDAGWRHSGLNLLLLMLMLKEAIGTCYFCRYPGSLGPAKRY